jgi:hypothetical protein
MDPKTLPIRANNPFALIQSMDAAKKWEGFLNINGNGFVFFDTPYSGTRAGFISFINTYLKRGINTIEKIFPMYAPASDPRNNPNKYIDTVSQLTKIPKNVPLTTAEQILAVGKAIIRVESGSDWIDNSILSGAYAAAANKTGYPQLKKGSVKLAIPFFFIILTATLWIIQKKHS